LYNSRIKENPYDRKRELASKFLKNLGLVSAGGYVGSIFRDNFYLGMIFLTLALGSAGVRHYFLEEKK
jgi:hypothetical protein